MIKENEEDEPDEEVIEGPIELTLSYSSKLPEWTNENVEVTAMAKINDNYIIEMKKNILCKVQ